MPAMTGRGHAEELEKVADAALMLSRPLGHAVRRCGGLRLEDGS
jgi:hypothetical protein